MTSVTRQRARNDAVSVTGPVLYWLQRDMRVQHNWALQYACAQAKAQGTGVLVLYTVAPSFPYTTARHIDFILRGLKEVAEELAELKIPFLYRRGDPGDILQSLVSTYGLGEVVTDFNPLRVVQTDVQAVAAHLKVRLTEVDAHNIVPCWTASPKAEFAAHTFRPKLTKLLKEYARPMPVLTKGANHSLALGTDNIDWAAQYQQLVTDSSVPAVTWLTPGTKAALKQLEEFTATKLDGYETRRNDPNHDALSNLSPYLHFGQLSAQVVYDAVRQAKDINRHSKKAFIDELVVRRELTDNYCFYTPQYDRVAGAHTWAQKTIAEHVGDKREFNYSQTQFEQAKTHDELWNSMQRQMVTTGKMHGWCRMYWAKKILEWTPDAQTAINIALYLNDKYELDGTDPNGIVGVMWSICGVHDRAWTERPIFGKIRYMNYNGAKRKFAIQEYIDRFATPESSLFND